VVSFTPNGHDFGAAHDAPSSVDIREAPIP
jgi:hypothetical protein